ncbi:hypothetical protein PSTEL_05100 [Paenibacillus stellifer]|uniref:Uncharacterized protein n=1 Tax=Paenibacillus stellifer TaxID=169760 RepID=A0A089N1K0_9BACL|nr:hypothetical protein [Paenibacillus stellifer]AIQ62569.1 hypothetical protein PSTEL_05100 [Paenibacillus stellifer]
MDPSNRIYRLNDREDAFVIVDLEKPQYVYNSTDLSTAFFRALITRRDGIYPLAYLLRPQFFFLS